MNNFSFALKRWFLWQDWVCIKSRTFISINYKLSECQLKYITQVEVIYSSIFADKFFLLGGQVKKRKTFSRELQTDAGGFRGRVWIFHCASKKQTSLKVEVNLFHNSCKIKAASVIRTHKFAKQV